MWTGYETVRGFGECIHLHLKGHLKFDWLLPNKINFFPHCCNTIHPSYPKLYSWEYQKKYQFIKLIQAMPTCYFYPVTYITTKQINQQIHLSRLLLQRLNVMLL